MDIFIYLPFRAEIRCFPFKLKKRNSTRKTVQVGPVVVVKKEKKNCEKKNPKNLLFVLCCLARVLYRGCIEFVWLYSGAIIAVILLHSPNVVYSRSALNLISYASKTTQESHTKTRWFLLFSICFSCSRRLLVFFFFFLVLLKLVLFV